MTTPNNQPISLEEHQARWAAEGQENMAHVFDARYRHYETFMTVSTPLKCCYCDDLTTWAHVERNTDEDGYHLRPYCPLHGFPQRTNLIGEYDVNTQLEDEEQAAAIRRFVLHMHDNLGHVEILASIDPLKAPGFYVFQKEDFDDEDYYVNWFECDYPRAWSVKYETPLTFEPTYYIVVYDTYYNSFHLCSQDGSCNPPQNIQGDDEEDDETMTGSA